MFIEIMICVVVNYVIYIYIYTYTSRYVSFLCMFPEICVVDSSHLFISESIHSFEEKNHVSKKWPIVRYLFKVTHFSKISLRMQFDKYSYENKYFSILLLYLSSKIDLLNIFTEGNFRLIRTISNRKYHWDCEQLEIRCNCQWTIFSKLRLTESCERNDE